MEFLGLQLGPQREALYVLRLYPPHPLRRQPLTFGLDSAEELRRWLRALTAAAAWPRPPAPRRRGHWPRLLDAYHGRGAPAACEPPPARLRLQVLHTVGLVATRCTVVTKGGEYPGSKAGGEEIEIGSRLKGAHLLKHNLQMPTTYTTARLL